MRWECTRYCDRRRQVCFDRSEIMLPVALDGIEVQIKSWPSFAKGTLGDYFFPSRRTNREAHPAPWIDSLKRPSIVHL